MISLFQTYIILGASAVLFAVLAFAVSRYLDRRDDFADVVWGLSFVVLTVICLVLHVKVFTWSPAVITAGLVGVWGIRLSIHIFTRFSKSKEEDHRYVAMRARSNLSANMHAFIRVFLSQAVLALLILSPAVYIIVGQPDYSLITYIGIIVWLVGFMFESIGDYQLKKFIANPSNKGKLMISGLWKFSRHPNYFGEMMQWWGLGIIALSVPFGWLSLIGPVLLTILLAKVSGVPLAEARSASKPGWQTYKQKTGVLIPFIGKN